EWNLLHYLISEGSVNPPRIVDWCEVLAYRLRGPKGLGETLLEAYLAKRATHHTAINNSVAADLIRTHNIPKTRVSVVPNGVSRDVLPNTRPEKEWGRILFVGRITPHKQPELLLRVAEALPYCVFVFVGSGDQTYVDRLKRIAPPNTHFLGEVGRSQLVEEYRKAWVFVLPSIREGSSISALEAMANYTPVITVSAPLNHAPHDVVRDGYNGVVVPNDYQSLAEGLRIMLENAQLYRELSNNAHETAEHRVWDVLAQRFAEVLQHVAAKRNN
ncbi:MAG: glycosyltransferase family 4 protein, partial [Thermoprotei archaeon]